MARGYTIQVDGLKQLQAKLKALPKKIVNDIDAIMDESARDFTNRAISDAPRDEGILIQGISYNKEGLMDYEIVSGAPHSAYVEFGTRSRAVIPPDLADIAAQFRGKGKGDYQDFLNAILDWVKRKGIVSRYSVATRKEIRRYSKDDNERLIQAAEAIAFSILRHGVKAHPYFFKQRLPVQKEMNEKIHQSIKKNLQ